MLYALVAIVVLNITSWIIMGIKFNKFFSTERFIEDAHEKVNDMITSINRNADRNIVLIDDKIKQLKAISAEAERRVQTLKNELEQAEKAKYVQQQLNAMNFPVPETTSVLSEFGENKTSKTRTSSKKSGKKVSSKSKSLLSEFAEAEIEENNVKTTDSPSSKSTISGRYKKNSVQKELFSTENDFSSAQSVTASNSLNDFDLMNKIQEADKALKNAQKQNKGMPQFYASPDPVKYVKDFNQQVRELNDLGFTVEEIAEKTGRSIQEVKLTIKFL